MKTTWLVKAIVAWGLLLTAACLWAQEGAAEPEGPFGAHPHKNNWQERRGRGQRGGGEVWKRMAGMREYFEQLKAENPEEFERLMQLRENDKRAFMTEMRKIMAEQRGGPENFGGQRPRDRERPRDPAEEKCMELGRLYHDAKDEAEKKRIKGELEAAVQEAFDKRLEMHREHLSRMEKEIEKVRSMIQSREEKRDAICGARLNELTSDPELRW